MEMGWVCGRVSYASVSELAKITACPPRHFVIRRLMTKKFYKQYNANHYSAGLAQVNVEQRVDQCPHCKTAISQDPELVRYSLPVNEKKVVSRFSGDGKVYAFFQCRRNDCQKPFIAIFGYFYDGNQSPYMHYNFERIIPFVEDKKEWPKEVLTVSPLFKEIYDQANSSEVQGLSHVCGPAYRKALEFLIKDYCISKLPEKESDIRSKLLGPCISTYVKDENIKACAERAVWLGNDETHYERRWDQKDIVDLKILIQLTVNHIQTEILTEKYKQDMTRS